MVRVLIAAVAACLALPAVAQTADAPEWRVASVSGDPFAPDVVVYYDATRLGRAAGGELMVRALWSYAAPQGERGYRSMLADVEMRCATAGTATTRASFHADARAQGASAGVFEPGELRWTAVEPKTVGDALLRAACADARRRGL
jgi:hypothetical protein